MLILLLTGNIFDGTNLATKFVLDSLRHSEKNLTSIRTLKTLKAWPNSHKKLSEQKMQLNHRIYTLLHFVNLIIITTLRNWTRFSILIINSYEGSKDARYFYFLQARFSVSKEISPHHQVCYDSFRCNAQKSKYLLKAWPNSQSFVSRTCD